MQLMRDGEAALQFHAEAIGIAASIRSTLVKVNMIAILYLKIY